MIFFHRTAGTLTKLYNLFAIIPPTTCIRYTKEVNFVLLENSLQRPATRVILLACQYEKRSYVLKDIKMFHYEQTDTHIWTSGHEQTDTHFFSMNRQTHILV